MGSTSDTIAEIYKFLQNGGRKTDWISRAEQRRIDERANYGGGETARLDYPYTSHAERDFKLTMASSRLKPVTSETQNPFDEISDAEGFEAAAKQRRINLTGPEALRHRHQMLAQLKIHT